MLAVSRAGAVTVEECMEKIETLGLTGGFLPVDIMAQKYRETTNILNPKQHFCFPKSKKDSENGDLFLWCFISRSTT